MTRRAAQLASLDLNLILVLRELLRERNVTRAAERVGVTQPAVSAALSRLRRHFGDDLLVRVSRGYVLSPLAVQLERQGEEVCAAARRVVLRGRRRLPPGLDEARVHADDGRLHRRRPWRQAVEAVRRAGAARVAAHPPDP